MRTRVVLAFALAFALTGTAARAGEIAPTTSSAPIGKLAGLWETTSTETCVGEDGKYKVKSRGVDGMWSSTDGSFDGAGGAFFETVVHQSSGRGLGFGILGAGDWLGFMAMVMEGSSFKGGFIALSFEEPASLITNVSGKFKSKSKFILEYGDTATETDDLAIALMGADDCGILDAFLARAAREVNRTAAGRSLGLGSAISRFAASRPAPAGVPGLSSAWANGHVDGEYGALGGGSCAPNHFSAAFGFLGEQESDVLGFEGPLTAEAIVVGSEVPERGMAVAFIEVEGPLGDWFGISLPVLRATYLKGMTFWAGPGGMIVANNSGRTLNDGSWFLDFGGDSLVEEDLSWALHSEDCGLIIV